MALALLGNEVVWVVFADRVEVFDDLALRCFFLLHEGMLQDLIYGRSFFRLESDH